MGRYRNDTSVCHHCEAAFRVSKCCECDKELRRVCPECHAEKEHGEVKDVVSRGEWTAKPEKHLPW